MKPNYLKKLKVICDQTKLYFKLGKKIDER